jgi:hypothetical protein
MNSRVVGGAFPAVVVVGVLCLLAGGAREVVEHCRRRGTFEDRLEELNAAIGNGLSAGSFEADEATLLHEACCCGRPDRIARD